MKQLFNIQTGEFTINDKLIVSKSLRIEELTSKFDKELMADENNSNLISTFHIRNLKIDDLYFILNFRFESRSLTRFQFILQQQSYSEFASWDDFDAKEEEEKGVFLTNWFENQIKGQPTSQSWGTAGVAYDFHNISYSIIVAFNQKPA